MSGFYGSKTNQLNLLIDKCYSNRKEMDTNAQDDGIFVGRCVAVSYAYDNNYNDNVNIDSDQYKGQTYDSTIWRKEFNGTKYEYAIIADLKGDDCDIQLVAPSSKNENIGKIVVDSDGNRALLVRDTWKINPEGSVSFNLDKITLKDTVSLDTLTDSIEWIPQVSEEKTYGEEKDEYKLNLQLEKSVGKAVSNLYDSIYGVGSPRPWLPGDSTSFPPKKEDGEIDYDHSVLASHLYKSAQDTYNTFQEKVEKDIEDFEDSILDKIYGEDSEGKRAWDINDWIDNPPTIEIDGKETINYIDGAVVSEVYKAINEAKTAVNNIKDTVTAIEEAAKSAEKATKDAEKATEAAEKAQSEFETFIDSWDALGEGEGTIPFVKEVTNDDGTKEKQFFGLTITGGSGVKIDQEIDSAGNPKKIIISINDLASTGIQPFIKKTE